MSIQRRCLLAWRPVWAVPQVTWGSDFCHSRMCPRPLCWPWRVRLLGGDVATEKPVGWFSKIGSTVRSLFSRASLRHPERPSVVVCPRDQMPAAVTVDASNLLSDCSRRRDQLTCDETCAPQLQYSGDDLGTFLAKNQARPCSLCGAPIGPEDWYGSRTAAAQNFRGKSYKTPAAAGIGSAKPICLACLTD